MSSVPYKYESFDKYTKRVELQQREAAKRQAIVDAERKVARAAARAKAATPEGIAEARAKSEAIAKGTARLQARLKKRAEKKTRTRDEYEPVRKAQLQHKIKGRNVFFAQFKANKIYQYDKIKTFVQEMQAKFRESNEVKTIQLRVELKTQEQYSTKVFDINDEILYQDPTNLYTAEDNDITGFTILIS